MFIFIRMMNWWHKELFPRLVHGPATWNPLRTAVCFNFTGTSFPEQSQSLGDALPLGQKEPLLSRELL